MIFDKRKIYTFDPYNVLLAIATNTLMTCFVVQSHKYVICPLCFAESTSLNLVYLEFYK